MGQSKLVTVIIPAYNEEHNVERTARRITQLFDAHESHYRFELLFVDDHSTDGTHSKLQSLARGDHRIRIIRFQRNYGMQRAVHTGYCHARGDAAIVLDCDLQDPPELIPGLLRHWEEGYSVVYGVRRSRKEGFAINTVRRIFYRLISKLSEDDLPLDVGDFQLVDRCVIEQLETIRDTDIYVRGRIASMGFPGIGIPYDRDAREFGESKFTLLKSTGLAMDGIVSHSTIPLRLATLLGLVLMLAALVGVIYYTVGRVYFGADWTSGFATLVDLLLFSMGLNFLILGVMGEYIARIYRHLKIPQDPIIESRIQKGEMERNQ